MSIDSACSKVGIAVPSGAVQSGLLELSPILHSLPTPDILITLYLLHGRHDSVDDIGHSLLHVYCLTGIPARAGDQLLPRPFLL